MSSNNSLTNGQVAINIELDRALHLERERTRILQEQRRIEGESKPLLEVALDTHLRLKKEKERFSKENQEMDVIIEKQKALLRDWMISQTAFRNLLKKYGKLPDGRSFSELSYDERVSIATAEEQHVVLTGDGIGDKQPNVKKIIMGT